MTRIVGFIRSSTEEGNILYVPTRNSILALQILQLWKSMQWVNFIGGVALFGQMVGNQTINTEQIANSIKKTIAE